MTHLFGYAYYPTLCIIDSAAPLCIPHSMLIKLFIIHQRSDFIIHYSLERPRRDLTAISSFIIHYLFLTLLRGSKGVLVPQASPYLFLTT